MVLIKRFEYYSDEYTKFKHNEINKLSYPHFKFNSL